MITLNGFKLYDPDSEMTTRFPDGEYGFQVIKGEFNVRWKYDDDRELLHLKMLTDHFTGASNLIIDYLPYSRMDRVHGNWVFTLQTVTDLINSMGFSYVWVGEPHSDVCLGMLKRAEAFYPTQIHAINVMRDINFDRRQDYIIFPDQGAEKRYADMYKGYKTMVGFKARDFDTGRITKFGLINNEDVAGEGPIKTQGRKALIIDDLCSYGGTFLATAETLANQYGITDTTLLVAHLENSVLSGKLLDSPLIRGVWGSNSIYRGPDSAGVSLEDARKFNKLHIYNVTWPRPAKGYET